MISNASRLGLRTACPFALSQHGSDPFCPLYNNCVISKLSSSLKSQVLHLCISHLIVSFIYQRCKPSRYRISTPQRLLYTALTMRCTLKSVLICLPLISFVNGDAIGDAISLSTLVMDSANTIINSFNGTAYLVGPASKLTNTILIV